MEQSIPSGESGRINICSTSNLITGRIPPHLSSKAQGREELNASNRRRSQQPYTHTFWRERESSRMAGRAFLQSHKIDPSSHFEPVVSFTSRPNTMSARELKGNKMHHHRHHCDLVVRDDMISFPSGRFCIFCYQRNLHVDILCMYVYLIYVLFVVDK